MATSTFTTTAPTTTRATTATTTSRAARVDLAHHHPTVRRSRYGAWCWQCSCGSASVRSAVPLSWHEAVVGALLHSACIAP